MNDGFWEWKRVCCISQHHIAVRQLEEWHSIKTFGTSNRKLDNMKKPVVLIVTRRGRLSESVKNYGLNVAERLDLRMLVAYVNTMPLLYDGGNRHRSFTEAARQDIADLKRNAAQTGISVDYIHESGKISKVVARLCRILNNLEFIIADSGVEAQNIVIKATVPVFVLYNNKLKRQQRRSEQFVSGRPQAHLCKLKQPEDFSCKEAGGEKDDSSMPDMNS